MVRLRPDPSQAGCVSVGMRLSRDKPLAESVSDLIRLRQDASQAGCASGVLRLARNPKTHHDASKRKSPDLGLFL